MAMLGTVNKKVSAAAGMARPEIRRVINHSKVVVTRTPLRVSFAGGGTDLPEFYNQEDGAVLDAAVDNTST